MRKSSWVGMGALLLVLAAPLVFGTTGATSFTMNWVIFTNKSFSVSYGGTCTNANINFNEIDANFDPDIDGNAAKVPPAGRSRASDVPTSQDFNYVGVVNPSPTNVLYADQDVNNPSFFVSTIATEATNTQYPRAATRDTLAFNSSTNTVNDYPGVKGVFRVARDAAKIYSLQVRYVGTDFSGLTCVADALVPATAYLDKDINMFLWDVNNGVYRRIATHQGDNSVSTNVNNADLNAIVDFNVARFVGSDSNITVLVQGAQKTDANGRCLFTDYFDLTVNYYPDENELCQSSTIAPITIYNNGNADVNVDGNFTSSITSTDLNVVLKVWQGTGSGCGTNGFGGWEQDCSVTQAQTAPTTTTCRQYNRTNATDSGRLITQLSPGSATQLCMSGDLNIFVSQGTHSKIFQARDYNA